VYPSSKEYQQLVLHFDKALPLAPVKPVLQLNFTYTLQEGLDGFYRSSYIGKQGMWVLTWAVSGGRVGDRWSFFNATWCHGLSVPRHTCMLPGGVSSSPPLKARR
jgi:hypothetical protein